MKYILLVAIGFVAAMALAQTPLAFKDSAFIARTIDVHSGAFVEWLPGILTKEQIAQIENWCVTKVTDDQKLSELESVKARLETLNIDAAVVSAVDAEITKLKPVVTEEVKEQIDALPGM
jgi:hypothetical protein